jgi:hypothetical protein
MLGQLPHRVELARERERSNWQLVRLCCVHLVAAACQLACWFGGGGIQFNSFHAKGLGTRFLSTPSQE